MKLCTISPPLVPTTLGDYSTELNLTATKAAEQIARAERFLQLAEQKIGPLPSAGREDA